MARRITALIIWILASLLITGSAWSEPTGDKATLLAGLATANQPAARASELVKSSQRDALQIELDLVFYRWASRSMNASPNVKNIDTVISSLAQALNDPLVNWAVGYFSMGQSKAGTVPLPPRDDARVKSLTELNKLYKSALDYRESSPIEAVKALQSAIKICNDTTLNMDISRALLLKQLGDHYHYSMTRYREAEGCYNDAAWTFSAYGCKASSANVYDEWGTLNSGIEKYQSAAEYYGQAARQWSQLASEDPSGYKFRDLAGLEYMNAGIAQSAAGNQDKALELWTTYGLKELRIWAHSTKSYETLIRKLISVAEFRRDRGEAYEAQILLEEARKVATDPLLSANILNELAKTYSVSKRTAFAEEAARKRSKILQDTAAAGDLAFLKLSKGIKDRPTQLGLCADAEKGARAYQEMQNYSKAVEVWHKVADAYMAAGLTDKRILALRAMADILDSQKQPNESLKARLEAVIVAMKAGKKALAAEIVQSMVDAFNEVNDQRNALEGLTDLALIVKETGSARGMAAVLEARGTLFAARRQNSEAIKDFDNARTSYLSQISDPWSAGEVSLKLAAAQRADKKTDDSLLTLKTALEQIEDNSSGYFSPAVTPKRYWSMLTDLYRDLASAYILGSKPDEAESLLNKARLYPWLPALISEMKSDKDPNIIAFMSKVNLLAGTWQDNQTLTSGEERVMADDWASLAKACLRLESHYRSDYNELPIDPWDIIKSHLKLPKDSVIVEYMLTDTAIYMFACSSDKALCKEIKIPKGSLETQVSALRRTIKSCEETLSAGIPIPPVNNWQETSFLEVQDPLMKLYSLLIEPIKDDIANRNRLIFILPSELAGLPMQALISNDDRTPKFLIEDYEISYLSRGMLEDLISKDDRIIDQNDRLAIFADPEGNLPGAQKEARGIKSVYTNSRWYIQDKATKASFIKECQMASIIHIAAHHKIDSDPTAFQLVLAPDSDSDGTIGLQDLSSITNVQLRLVVLSACDSISSSDPISNGPSGAAEFFSLIGTQSIMGGLWKVSDRAASSFMEDFYRVLGKSSSRSSALQYAQKSLIKSKEYSHPFYWACFALYGDPR